MGPITAMAILAFAPPMGSFEQSRNFSAWLGLEPRQHTTGGMLAAHIRPDSCKVRLASPT